ncbi:MAG: hypothetical protein SGI74_01395 [Oligoflexia bacterium]|nr:hypothetical protein [Oligoflexia bacterium]
MNRLLVTLILTLVLVVSFMSTAQSAVTDIPYNVELQEIATKQTAQTTAECSGDCLTTDKQNPTTPETKNTKDIAAVIAIAVPPAVPTTDKANQEALEADIYACEKDKEGNLLYGINRGKCLTEKIKQLVKDRKHREDIMEAMDDLEVAYNDFLMGEDDEDSFERDNDEDSDSSSLRRSRRNSRRSDRSSANSRKREVKKFEKLIEGLDSRTVKNSNVRARAREILLFGKHLVYSNNVARVENLKMQIKGALENKDYSTAQNLVNQLNDRNLMKNLFETRGDALVALRNYNKISSKLDPQYDWAIKNSNENLISAMNRISSAQDSSSDPRQYQQELMKLRAAIETRSRSQVNEGGTVANQNTGMFGDILTELGVNRPRTQNQNGNGTNSNADFGFNYSPRSSGNANRISLEAFDLSSTTTNNSSGRSIFDTGSTAPGSRLGNYLNSNPAAQYAVAPVGQNYLPTTSLGRN